MCKLMEDLRNEAAREAAITSVIKAARRYNLTDAVILKDIMDEFQLTEDEAKAYMEKKPA